MGLTNNLGKLSNMITSTGSAVGIAQPSPSYTLDVSGTGRFTGNVGVGSGTLNSYTGYSVLTINNSTTGSVLDLNRSGVRTGTFYADTSGVGIGALTATNLDIFTGNSYIDFQTNGTERMRITSAGNVGIGTSSPNGPLDIVGPLYSNTYTLSLYDSAAVAADIGGGIYFGAKYNSTTYTGWAGILGRKDNATSGEYGGYMSFLTRTNGSAPAERMRITSGGNVIINGTTAAYSSTNRGNLTISGSASSLLGFHNGTSQTGYIYNDYSANLFQWYSVSNNIQVTAVSNGVQLSSGATSWSSVSDERLKNITGNIENAIESLMTLRTIKHTWKSDETNKENLGLIAQDVQKVFPQVIDINKLPSKLDDEYKDDTEYLAVRYTELVPVLVKAIQEQNQLITSLQDRLTKGGL